MIKRFSFSIVILVFSAVSLVAATVTRNDITRTIALQGIVGEVATINIEPIVSQTQGFAIGIPFNIQESLVQYDGSGTGFGRAIAHWSVISNTDFVLRIKADKLEYADKEDLTENEIANLKSLDYRLKFNYNMGYYYNGYLVESGNKLLTLDTKTKIQSPDKPADSTGEGFVFDLFSGIEDQPSSGVRGCVDGTVYFMFSDGQTDIIADDSKTPPGNYEAVVVFTMEAK